MNDISHITNVAKTSRSNEIALTTSKGLFFSEIVDFGEWRVTVIDEHYYKDQDIRSAIEYKRDLFAVCLDSDLNIYIIDRKLKVTVKQIENPSGCDRPLCMKLIPGFDLDKLPFSILRDQEGLTVVNLKSATAYKICESWYH